MPLDGARFESRVDRSGLHHIWLGARSPGGGGQVAVDSANCLPRSSRVGDRERFCARRCPGLVVRRRTRLRASGPSTTRSTRRSRRHHHRRRSVRREAPGRLPRSRPECGRTPASQPASIGSDSVAARSAPSMALETTRPQRWRHRPTEIGDGHRLLRQDDKQLTVDSLVDWYLEFAREDRGLEHSTLTGYADAYSHWLKEPIGHKRASSITTADSTKPSTGCAEPACRGAG